MNKLENVLNIAANEVDNEGDPKVIIGMQKVMNIILNEMENSEESNAVLTLTVDDSVPDLLRTFGKSLESMLREFWTLNDQTAERMTKPRQVPAEFMRLISPAALSETMDSLDLAITAEAAASDAKEASYGGKGDLLRQKAQLETSIKITEAEAMSKVQGEGKSQYVSVAGEKLFLTNDQTRDAYRRMASKSDREELARINGELGRIEVDQFKATDAWYGAKGVADSVGRKAGLQEALLNFLAGRG